MHVTITNVAVLQLRLIIMLLANCKQLLHLCFHDAHDQLKSACVAAQPKQLQTQAHAHGHRRLTPPLHLLLRVACIVLRVFDLSLCWSQ
jgi:hypothetical protein